MPKAKKLGSQAESIFDKKRPSTSEQAPPIKAAAAPEQPAQGRGRPPKPNADKGPKTTVVLGDRHIFWLDSLSSQIKLNTRTSVSRSELIRALIAFAKDSGIDLSEAKSEEEVCTLLLKRIK